MQHLISIKDLDAKTILDIIHKAYSFDDNHNHPTFDKPKILATLFFEPSTRTRLSFESAMIKLGGSVIGFSDAKTSSIHKGETIYDTIRTIEAYCDAVVIRHPLEGTARLAANATKLQIPIINGGSGSANHPTQSLTDLMSIHKKLGKLTNLKIAYMGDLKYGRTVHSLVEALSLFDNNEHHFIPPHESLDIGCDFIQCLTDRKQTFYKHKNPILADILKDIDVLYVTRLQKERFPDEIEYSKIMKNYQIKKEHIEKVKKEMIILHPLPRNDEIHREIDELSNAYYFEQAHNGIAVRMALLHTLLVSDHLKK